MNFFLLSALLALFWFGVLKAGLYFLARMLPEGQRVYESVSHYVWGPAALLAFATTNILRAWLR